MLKSSKNQEEESLKPKEPLRANTDQLKKVNFVKEKKRGTANQLLKSKFIK